MKNLQTVEHDFPIYWNTYIMYGDSSGLEDGEQEIIDEILKKLELTNCVDIKDNQYFTWDSPYHMPSGYGGDYATYVFLEDLGDSQAGEDSQAGTNTVSEPIKNNQLELFPKS